MRRFSTICLEMQAADNGTLVNARRQGVKTPIFEEKQS